MKRWQDIFLVLICLLPLAGCYALRSSSGGGETSFEPPRQIIPANVALPDGYTIEAVATGLTFPTGIAFDDAGGVYVTEAGYSYGEVFTVPKLLKVAGAEGTVEIARGVKSGPWTGVTYHAGHFYVAAGNQLGGGMIIRIAPDGGMIPLIEGLPSRGDHHTNGPVAGPDGWIYFTQGTATNSGVVGKDNAAFGWLKRFPDFHDIPCENVTPTGENFAISNPLTNEGEEVTTGPFVPFGTAVREGQIIPGDFPCSGAVMRIRPEGGRAELVAWGLRNPFGLAFSPEGRLFVTDNSYDDRGSRPIFGTGDLLWEIRPGTWYGWPDFHGERPLADERFQPPGRETPESLLGAYPNQPPRPAAILPVHSSADGFDFSRHAGFGYVGEAFVAEFGDQATSVGKTLAPVGFKIVRVDVERGVPYDFAVNRGPANGPASLVGGGGLERPVAARFDPSGRSLYIVDFGVLLQRGEETVPVEKTGVVWRIYRSGNREGDER